MWVKIIFGPKKFRVRKNCLSEKLLCPKILCLKFFFLGQKKFGPEKRLGPKTVVVGVIKKIRVKNIFGQKTFSTPKILGQKNLGLKKCWVRKNFQSEKISGSDHKNGPQNFGSKNFG